MLRNMASWVLLRFCVLDQKKAVKEFFLVLLLAISTTEAGEDDGNELLDFMQRPASYDATLAYIDDVRTRWDDSLFCISGDDRQARAFDAVKHHLEGNPQQCFRPRRYLIIQGLRVTCPCQRR